jgi:hypothetical protein
MSDDDDASLPSPEQVAAASRGEETHPVEPHSGGGAAGLALTYGIGHLFGSAVH